MKINLNDPSKLQDLKLLLTERNVSSTAITTIEKALRTGMSFKQPEDLTILNIPTLDLNVVGELVEFGPKTVVVKNIKTTEYRFTPVGDESFFFGYQFIVTFVNRDGFSIEESYPIEDLDTVIVDYDLNNLKTNSVVTLRVNTSQGKHARIRLSSSDLNDDLIQIPIPQLGNATIEVEVDELQLPGNPSVTAAYPIKGKLISNRSDAKMDGYQIVIFAGTKPLANGNTPDFPPVAFARTETNGYFVTSPLLFENEADIRRVTSAKALITRDKFRAELAIRLVVTSSEDDGQPTTSMLPDRLILVIDESIHAGKTEEGCTDCDCTDLNFHEKKVLEEHSYYTVVRTSEPSIIADVLEEEEEIDLQDIFGVSGTVPLRVLKKFQAIESRQTKALLGTVTPTPQPQLVNGDTPSTALTIRTTAAAVKGPTFNRDLLNRLVVEDRVNTVIRGNAKPVFKGRTRLNPLNQIDWDNEPTIYQAASIAHGHLLHFKQEWIADGYSIGDLAYSLPLAPGQKKQIAVLDWERRESAANSQSLDYEETLNNSLIRDRDINEVVSGTLTENLRGNSKASTGGIGFGFGAAAMGLLPGGGSFGALLGISGGTSSSGSSAGQNSSRESTANSLQSISDRTQQAASVVRSQRSTVVQTVSQGERVEATSESVANYNHCHAITIQYFEVLRHFAVRNRLASVQECLFVPLQIYPFDLDKCLRWRSSLERHLFKRQLRPAFEAVARIQNEKESASENYYDSIGFPRKNFAEQAISNYTGELFMQFFFFNTKEEKIDEDIVNFYRFFGISLDDFRDRTITDEELAEHVGPRAIEYLLDAFTVETDKGIDLKLDLSLISTFRQNGLLRISMRQSPRTRLDVARDQIEGINIKLDLNKITNLAEKESLKSFQNKYMKIRLRSASLRYRTDNFAGTLLSGRIDNDIFADDEDGAFIATPPTREELRNPRGEDVNAANNLIQHLNENLEYYHKCLFFDMTPERRFMLLDGIIAPGKALGRSVASVVENRVIGIAGNSLIMPVAPGYQLDPTIDETFDLFAQYFHEDPEPMRISMPTKGIFAEAVMGKCNSCEAKDESKFWRWEESPIPDSPTTPILPINTDTRRADPGNLQPKDFPAPVVNIQNAPNVPDPTGLQSLIQLLGKGDSFRDLTGLNQNQLNALATFQKTLDTAQAFGKEAADLAKTASANKLIEDAQKSGAISNEKAKELTEKNLNAAIPSTPAQQLETAKSQLSLIDSLEQQGQLTTADAQAARNTIVGKLSGSGDNATSLSNPKNLNNVLRAVDASSVTGLTTTKKADGTEELSITKDLQASTSNQLDLNATDATPQQRTFNPPFGFGRTLVQPRADLEQNNNLEFHWVLEDGMASANTGNNVTIGVQNFNGNTAQFTDPAGLHLLAKQPGIFAIGLVARDKTTRQTLPTLSTIVGVPQFVVITESTDVYAIDPEQKFYAGINNPHLFATVLQRLGLDVQRDLVLSKTKQVTELLLRTVNVRLIWDIPLSSGLRLDDKQAMLGFQTDKIPDYERDFVTPVLLRGYPDSFGTHGVTHNSSIRTFNEHIEIFPGMMDYPRTPFDPIDFPVDFRIQQILLERDALITRISNNPGDQAAKTELNELMVLWLEVFSRMLGHTIAHEVCHSLLGKSGGFGSKGHTPPGPGNLLSSFPDSFTGATGLTILNPNSFPKRGSVNLPTGFLTTVLVDEIQFAFAFDEKLKTQLDVLYAVPPTPPFDK